MNVVTSTPTLSINALVRLNQDIKASVLSIDANVNLLNNRIIQDMTVLLNVTVIMLITIIMFLLFGVFQLVNHLPPNIITSLKIISSADVLHETLPVINPYYSEAKKIKEDITRYHHERWDGLGYPYGLRGFEIPLVARIVAVADVFDALSSKRSYKPAFSFEESLQIIKNASESQLDPFIVEVFFEESPQLRSIYNSFN